MKFGITSGLRQMSILSTLVPLLCASQLALADDQASPTQQTIPSEPAVVSQATTQDATAATGTSAAATSTSVLGTATSGKPIQGSVEKVELTLEDLRDIGLDLKDALKAASSLYDEVTTQRVRMITQPSMVGRGIIINIPIGTEPVGPVEPARKNRVDAAMAGLSPIVAMMKQDVDGFTSGNRQLDLDDNIKTELHPQFQKWIANVNQMAEQEAQLQSLTSQGPPYKQSTIAATVVAMEKNIKTLDDTRNVIYKAIRKEGKKKKR